MVRQLYEDLKDDLTDSFKNGVKDVVDTFNDAKEFVNRFDIEPDTTPDIFFPDIHQDECNTIITVNTGYPGSNLQITYRNPNCPLPEPSPLPPFDPSAYRHCGTLVIVVLYAWVEAQNSITKEITKSKTSASAFHQKYQRCYPTTTSLKQLVESIAPYTVVNADCYPTNPPFGRYTYPTYFLFKSRVYVFPGQDIEDRLAEIATVSYLPVSNPEVFSVDSDSSDPSCQYPPPDYPRLPPPPPPPMTCCPNVKENDQLLRLILKRIGEPKEVIIFDEDLNRKGSQKAKKKPESLNDFLKLAVERTEIISRIVGIENFPITLPETMIEPHKEGVFAKIFGFIDGKKKRKINTIAELITWMSEQDSAVLGQFHQVIDFETGGKDKKGKAEKATVVLPNVAETLKEIIILTSQMALQNNVQTELIFKIASEVVAARAAAHKSAVIAADIQDYLDYPTETKSAEITTNVNFPKITQNKKGQFEVTSANEDYKEFLKAGSVKISYDDWTGDTSLRDQLIDLLQVASALRASMMQRIDK